ncbi:Asp-tRNA(Asn)/Glu-tRNA(Gln) amidotransferase subunit GatA [Methyloversatilis sp. XJ19-13]|uniref:Asp-tRNA(Asn)/Glu-tRNA(Gln) amidotransferase subunit GatA n=1 Tax=Methyloversatilis sp. XJ19-13 TaxID=2963430 RepID=UPI00211C8B08|nr:Asp-tRNA(Asn)/Glu-tRNA(Gln) amidotransferase subunit GatA [Methyloversatilis sp. XJ19-13]MCQ9376125.1 Asp-tRNA(Asn)/Glu-tRNA(Gln) amidotransferase subunit GatA [Methyloversatilis sp. XJ19-13]
MSDRTMDTVKQLSARLAAGEVSAVELAQDYLAKIQAANPALNAFVELNEAQTLIEARAADALRAEGRAGPLTGVPIAHKDIFCQTGWHARCGSKMLENFAAPYDAGLIERARAAGLVTLGRTNMDEFAMGSTNESSHYGVVHNPWQLDAVPGGSSGGSAAAVAAGIAPAASGTDTGGSIRQPAAFCGITGIKPTYGIVSRWGMIAYASSLDQGGPMAHTAEDCALLLNAFAGFDTRDATSLERAPEDYTRALDAPLAGLRIGVPKEFFGEGMSDDVRAAVEAALATFRTLGARTVEVSLPRSGYAVPAYYVIAPAEASSNLNRFDGVRYGYRAPEYRDLNDMYAKTRAQGFGEEVKRRILIGTYVLSHGYYDAYYLQAQRVRRLIADDYRAAFRDCDLILGPTTPTVAYGIGDKADDPLSMYLGDIYTTSVNLAGLPGMSIPCGFGAGDRPAGLPIGLQIVGNYFDEARMLGAAHRFQQATDWHLRTPPG